MPVDKKIKAYTLYSFVRFLVEEVILAVTLSFLLPRFGINIPLWLLIVFMEAWAFYSYLTSKLVAKAINRPAAVGTEALVGIKGTTTTLLSPDGCVRVGSELWQAHSMAGDIETGVEVIIVNINRLTLLVRPSVDTSPKQKALS
jgi:membrane-bound ClpP family serine protease